MKINLDLTEKNKHKHFFREIKIPYLLTKYEMYDWNNLEPDKHDEEMNNYCTPEKYNINQSIWNSFFVKIVIPCLKISMMRILKIEQPNGTT